jgi:DNA-binding winged helix-turn-helix (wHTH) protein/tetratricopeptide (TPR) repeat protein
MKEIYEFGDFRADPAEQLLLHRGQPVALTPKVFETLLILLKSEGRLIDKDDFIRQLWPGVFVEDVALAKNISYLRRALGDGKNGVDLIQTVPKRGYRFGAPVRKVSEQNASLSNTDQDVPTERLATAMPAKKWVFAFLIGLAIAIGAGAFLLFFRGTRVLSANDTVVLADFANSTGDPVFDDTLRRGMAVQLEQSPFLSLISEEQIQQALRLMGQPADARLTPAIARQICERTGSAAVLDGSIASMGSQYVLGLRATDCHTGRALAEEQVQAGRKEEVLSSLSEVANKFRTQLGESLTTVDQYDTPLAEATTPSLEALRAYSAGWKVVSSKGSAAALPFFKHAIELDPKFAMAYAELGRMYGDIGEPDLSAENTGQAYHLRDRASEAEKFFITASYDLQVTGNMEKAQTTCQAWAQTYPREAGPHGFLSGIIYPVLGRYEKAVEEGKKALELNGDFAVEYSILALDYQGLNQWGEAEHILQVASARKMEIPDLLVARYQLAFLEGDEAAMGRAVDQGQGASGAEDLVAEQEAFTQAYGGHLQQARRKSQRAVDLAQQSGEKERAALFEAGAALREAFFGNATTAKQDAIEVLRLSQGRDAEYGAAFALALAGDSVQSRTLAEALERRLPEDSAVRFSYLPEVRALLALNHGEPAKAIELLQLAVPYELGDPPSSFLGYFGSFYPQYVRGEAYLAAHQGEEAAAEFQMILDHRGIVVSDPIGALAHLQLGRAYVLSGETTKAKAAYRDFLTLWKDADPDIPILQQAKVEYAKLT